jgi:hypothetical protein
MIALLLLWDVDHTLIENHGVNKETYAAAFELITGKPPEHRARTAGRTEPEVMRDMLALHGGRYQGRRPRGSRGHRI